MIGLGSDKNGSKMTKLTFLQHAVPEFSEKCFGSKKNKAPRPWNSASSHLGRFWEARICHFCSLGFVLSTIYISDLPSLTEAYVAVIQSRLPKWWSKNIYSVTSIDPSITTISSRDEYDTDVQSFILNQQIIKFIAVPISLLEWCWDWVQGGDWWTPIPTVFSLSSYHSHIWPILVNFFSSKSTCHTHGRCGERQKTLPKTLRTQASNALTKSDFLHTTIR